MSVLLSRNCFKCCQNFTRYPQRVIQTLTAYYADQEVSVSLRSSAGASLFLVPCRQKSGKDKELSSLFQPVISSPTENSPDDINVGEELSGQLDKAKLLQLLNQFYQRQEIKILAAENGLDKKLFHQAYLSFRKFCSESGNLPADLHVILSDILHNAGHVDDIYPYFLRHAREVFPHLGCMEDLKKISDLRLPANWYPEARAIERKIIFHAGPTNSGKTYHALQRFLMSKSGVYCGPLKLLAAEVFNKSNAEGTPCDLVTGEERRYAKSEETPSDHAACTVEMTSVNLPYEVAIIDEIQMIKDQQRGWAWTRALLGLCAQEIHLCGEASAIDLVRELMKVTGDTMEVRKYKRLTKLTYLDKPVESFDNVRDGDCFVCFSKNDIYYISRELEKRGKQVAVIYGGLPPGTKLAQAQKFNDPNDPCKIMVATDAIGMGLNLSIKRVIFYSLVKPTLNEKGEKEMDVLTPSQALQIAGRAGRYGTPFENGEVTTYRREDLLLLKDVTSRIIEPIEQAGLHPTADQIELFAYHLPHSTLSNLMDIFVTLSQLDNDYYFMCNVDDFKFLADMIEHVPLPLRVRYVFCCSPIPKKQPFVCTSFLKFARQFSQNEPLTLSWLCKQIGWPLQPPKVLADLVHLESVFDVLDLYLWLSYRFPDMFPDVNQVRYMQQELDSIIQIGVYNITSLLKAIKSESSSEDAITVEVDDDDDFDMSRRVQQMLKQKLTKIDEGLEDGSSGFSEKLSDSFQKAKNLQAINSLNVNAGHLTEQLLKKGLITPDILQKLLEEWTVSPKQTNKGKNRQRWKRKKIS